MKLLSMFEKDLNFGHTKLNRNTENSIGVYY